MAGQALGIQLNPRGRWHRGLGWILLVLIFFLAQQELCYPIVLWLSHVAPGSLRLLGGMPAFPLVECVLVLLLVFWSPNAFGLKLGNHRKVWWIYVACGVCYAAFLLFGRDLLPYPGACCHRMPSAYLLAPFREELLFRGFMYGVLVEMYPSSEASRKWISKPVLFTAILFGLWHLAAITFWGWSWGLGYVGYTFFAGLVMGYARRRSGSILGPFFMHAVGNYITGL